MKVLYFTHSLASCWNHGNAHFLRGVLRELVHDGHDVAAYEPKGNWSLAQLIRDHGERGLAAYRDAYPELSSTEYDDGADIAALVDGADLVLVHEWNEPWLVAALGKLRRGGGKFTLLFHDTHHRAVSDPEGIRRYDLDGYDGVLAFGAALADVYRGWGWGDRAFVWHEAADIRLFKPPTTPLPREGLVWIGNWGDEERSQEIEDFLLRPAAKAHLPLDVYGVRYPEHGLDALERHGARFRGWAPNARAPEIFARHLATVHVPRRFYVSALPGIPTIRVFEALACGIPLLSAPWDDAERLFTPGEDYLVARDGAEMAQAMRAVADDPELAARLAEHGRQTILARHTCRARVEELLAIVSRLRAASAPDRTP